MDNVTRRIVRCLMIAAFLMVLMGAVFLAGFGSAHLLAQQGVVPITAAEAPTPAPQATPVPVEPAGEEAEAPPAPAPIPIPTPRNEDEEAFQLFWEVWDLVQRNFYGELPDMQELTYAAIRGMLLTLDDDYTAFIEPEAAAIFSEDATGEFEGIGAFVGLDETGILQISDVFENGPAAQAGVKPGDRVLEVDGESIIGLTLYEAISMIRGPEGSQVTLLIRREELDEPFEITITRARLENPTVEVEMLENDVGYLQLNEFSATATEKTEEGIADLLAQDPVGIVFDLRGNPGGWLDQAVDVADLFMDDGVILYERWSDGRERSFEAQPGDLAETVPIVVLVNGGSASASEIVAGALQDQDRAVLVGELTFGKGSVQQPFNLRDGSELRVTIARWFTPDDRAIHGEGLEPDVVVPWPEDGVEPGEDPQLEQAIDVLLEGE